MAVLTKDKQIKKEIERFNELLEDLGEERLKGVHSLIENVAFMTVTLKELQKQINENGFISEYQNGANQWGTKKSPEIEIYNSMIKNHMTALKQLVDLIPKTNGQEPDELMQFLLRGRED